MVQIPPWLNFDPIAPVRIAQQSAEARARAAAAERAAQLRQQEIDLRSQVEQAHIAAQERASYRHQIMTEQLAQAEAVRRAQDLQFRREHMARQAAQFEQSLRLREHAAETAAAEGAIQAEGWRGVEADQANGIPMEQSLPRHASKLFYRHPERAAQALHALAPPPVPQEGMTAGGQKFLYGANVHFPPGVRAPRTELSPGERLAGLKLKLLEARKDVNDARKDELPAATKRLKDVQNELQQFLTPAPTATPTSAPLSPGKLDESTPPDQEEADMMPDEEQTMEEDTTAPVGVGDEGDTGD